MSKQYDGINLNGCLYQLPQRIFINKNIVNSQYYMPMTKQGNTLLQRRN